MSDVSGIGWLSVSHTAAEMLAVVSGVKTPGVLGVLVTIVATLRTPRPRREDAVMQHEVPRLTSQEFGSVGVHVVYLGKRVVLTAATRPRTRLEASGFRLSPSEPA